MKRSIALSLIALLSVPAFAGTSTMKTSTYESTETENLVDPAVPQADSDMIEAQEEGYNEALDQEAVDLQRMEDRENEKYKEEMQERNETEIDDDDVIDYQDRTRTNRERKALNTGGNASDDQ